MANTIKYKIKAVVSVFTAIAVIAAPLFSGGCSERENLNSGDGNNYSYSAFSGGISQESMSGESGEEESAYTLPYLIDPEELDPVFDYRIFDYDWIRCNTIALLEVKSINWDNRIIGRDILGEVTSVSVGITVEFIAASKFDREIYHDIYSITEIYILEEHISDIIVNNKYIMYIAMDYTQEHDIYFACSGWQCEMLSAINVIDGKVDFDFYDFPYNFLIRIFYGMDKVIEPYVDSSLLFRPGYDISGFNDYISIFYLIWETYDFPEYNQDSRNN